jgi:hypothetical protein
MPNRSGEQNMRAFKAHTQQRQYDEWRRANREAIREANEELAENGLWSEGLRLFLCDRSESANRGNAASNRFGV